MLRKKLSKLIVVVMAAVMLSGGMSGVGQAVFANTSAEVITAESRKTENIDANNTNEEQAIKYINDDTVSVLKVTGGCLITGDMAKALNARTTPLTIEVQNNSFLVINNAIKLDGNNSKLKIARGAGKTGAMLQTKPSVSNRSEEATVTGVTFDNNGVGDSEAAVINEVANKIRLILDGNTLLNGGALSYTSTSDKNIYTNNNLGTGWLLKDQQMIEFSIDDPQLSIGGTTVTMSGSTTNYDSIATVGGTLADIKDKYVTLTITETDSTTGHVVEKVKLDDLGRFSGKVISGLNPGKKYKVEAEAIYKDKEGNTYSRKSAKSYEFTTYTFSSSVTNITNSSATININHGNLPDVTPTKYPLTLTINGVSYKIDDKNMTSVNVTGLVANTSYTYEIKDAAGNGNVIDKGTFPTTSSTITGGGITGGGSTGGSVTSGDLTTNDINRADIKDVSSYIPVGNTTLANSLRDGRDYKTNIEGVTVTYSNGKVEFTGLVPEKDYKDLTITYTDKDGRTRTVKVPSFKTKASETKLRQFIVDVYRYSLDRVADERGFAYWEDQLKNKKTSPDEFVKNLLNEPEFINKHTTTTAKIEGLYQVIVNRKSDSQGLSFWTKKYDDLVAKGYSESMALRVIVDEMVNEQEFKNRVRDLGL